MRCSKAIPWGIRGLLAANPIIYSILTKTPVHLYLERGTGVVISNYPWLDCL